MRVSIARRISEDLPGCVDISLTEIDETHKARLDDMGIELPQLSANSVTKRRNEFYAGRWCAAESILKLTGTRNIPGINPDRSPAWPKGLVGSITHTDDYAVAVVALADEINRVGIDLENIERVGMVEGLALQISTEKEAGLFPESDRALSLALLFSAKESLFKALYPECKRYFDYLDAEAVAVDTGVVVLALLTDLGSAAKTGDRFKVRYIYDDGQVFTWLITKRVD